jgi:hypothetical protein
MSKIELALILAISVFLIGTGWMVRGWHDQAALEKSADETAKKIEELQKQAQADAANYETGRAISDATISKLKQTMEGYRAKDKIPADCFIPADGLHVVADAINAGRAR